MIAPGRPPGFLGQLFGGLLIILCLARMAHATEASQVIRLASSFDRSAFTTPNAAADIKAFGSLAGTGKGTPIAGWAEYDFTVPADAWYQLSVAGVAEGVEFTMDPQAGDQARGIYAAGPNAQQPSIASFWLLRGSHTLRLQRYVWTGFPPLKSFSLRSLSESTAVPRPIEVTLGEPRLYRPNKCARLGISSHGSGAGSTLNVKTVSPAGLVLSSQDIAIASGAQPQHHELDLPCATSGVFTVLFSEDSRPLTPPYAQPVQYEVIGPPARLAEPQRTLVDQIDCVATDPHYFGGGATHTTHTAAGAYRESSSTGFTRFQRAPPLVRRLLAEPSWFAYAAKNIVPQRPHLVEVDYPDDTLRTFVIALREGSPIEYPVAGGVDSGGQYLLSNQMQTQRLIYWPRSTDTRVVFMNAHDGRRAACAKIRIYRLDDAGEKLPKTSPTGRLLANWYEEGSNFFSIYGAPDGAAAARVATERWAHAVRAFGGNLLIPTVSVYSFALYPSRYNLAFSSPDFDLLRRILLTAETAGLKVLPQLHPRADELAWPFTTASDPKPNLLVSKEGATRYYASDGKTRNYPPLYSAIYPANQDWYVGMISELVERYKDSPALIGVDLRLMQWQNPALNNFNSLDWGYDDYSVRLFEKEAHVLLPADLERNVALDPRAIAQGRYKWITANARASWISWRCQKIAELYARIRDRVRALRPDLKVYSSIFRWEDAGASETALREAGVDVSLLAAIDGVELINAGYAYGRKEADVLYSAREHSRLTDPRELKMLVNGNAGARFITPSSYIEATADVVTPAELGFPDSVKRTFTSATVSPAGRNVLESYALQLAETDAVMLGDGGNGYSLGQHEQDDFLRVFSQLPPERFTARADAQDPVAIRELRSAAGYEFYAVNRERYSVTIDLRFSPGTLLHRVGSAQTIDPGDKPVSLTLVPYELIAYTGDSSAVLQHVTTVVPDRELRRVQRQVEWLDKLRQSPGQMATLSTAQSTGMRELSIAATNALQAGHLWRARTLLESPQLLEIFIRLNRYPPE